MCCSVFQQRAYCALCALVCVWRAHHSLYDSVVGAAWDALVETDTYDLPLRALHVSQVKGSHLNVALKTLTFVNRTSFIHTFQFQDYKLDGTTMQIKIKPRWRLLPSLCVHQYLSDFWHSARSKTRTRHFITLPFPFILSWITIIHAGGFRYFVYKFVKFFVY